MLESGIPILRALIFFGEGEQNEQLRQVLDAISNKVSQGHRLSNAMRAYPTVFSEVYCSLIETGETSGQLSTVLERLADLLERQVKLRQRVLSTLSYPCVLLGFSMTCIGVFILFVLPMIEPVFLGMKIDLPWPTKVLLATKYLLWPAVTAAFLSATLGWLFSPSIHRWLKSHPNTHLRVSRLPLTIPVLGSILQRTAVARMLGSMATMLDAGMGLVPALRRCSGIVGNHWVSSRVDIIRSEIQDGKEVSEAFRTGDIFPESTMALVAVGEETSNLIEMLQYTSRLYEEDVESALIQVTTVAEPLLMGGMGIIVGFIIVAAMLPTLTLINNL